MSATAPAVGQRRADDAGTVYTLAAYDSQRGSHGSFLLRADTGAAGWQPVEVCWSLRLIASEGAQAAPVSLPFVWTP